MATANATIDDLKAVYTPAAGVTDDTLQVFVDIGNMIVNEQIVPTSCGSILSQERVNKISTYVAAHFADVSGRAAGGDAGPLKQDKMGEAQQTFAVPDQNANGYQNSRWGQLALALDTCNILLSSPKLKATFRVVGDNHIGDGSAFQWPINVLSDP